MVQYITKAASMAPTQSKGLSYESEDVKLILSFEKKGKRKLCGSNELLFQSLIYMCRFCDF